jgi:hypothetical protein
MGLSVRIRQKLGLGRDILWDAPVKHVLPLTPDLASQKYQAQALMSFQPLWSFDAKPSHKHSQCT